MVYAPLLVSDVWLTVKSVWFLLQGKKWKMNDDTVIVNQFAHKCILALRKEGNVLFNDTLNTFYLWLYGVRHMVKDHSDSERGNPLLPHGLLFSINSKGYFICTIPQTG